MNSYVDHLSRQKGRLDRVIFDPVVTGCVVIFVYRMNVSYYGFINILLQLSTVIANMINPSVAINKRTVTVLCSAE